MEISEKEFVQLKKLLCRVSGIDIPSNKKYLFETRLSSFLLERGYECFSEFYHVLKADGQKALEKTFVQFMTTHESSFFRDSHPFQLLETKLLPKISARRKAEAVFMPARIRILSAGCSHGQEPYSIAMCVNKWRKKQADGNSTPEVTIAATDISQNVLERARQGCYTSLEVGSSLPEEYRRNYFISRDGHWEIAECIKQMVTYSELNLSEPFDFPGKFDIIFCRNVIIYFPLDVKQKVIKCFQKALHKEGLLILGASENLFNIQSDFESRSEGNTMVFVLKK